MTLELSPTRDIDHEEFAGKTFPNPTYTIFDPSGDQAGSVASKGSRVSCSSPVPSMFMIHTWFLPSVSVTNATRDPSREMS